MKIRFLRLIALVLTAAVLLSGCGMVDFGEYFGAVRSLVDGNAIVPYESMTYERPDMTQLQQTLDAACEAAEGDDVSAILDGIYDFYDAYDWFSTYYALADIHYCADLTDTYWEDEYNYCTQNAAHGGRRLAGALPGACPVPRPGETGAGGIFRRGLF